MIGVIIDSEGMLCEYYLIIKYIYSNVINFFKLISVLVILSRVF